jgi:hypothetical protein
VTRSRWNERAGMLLRRVPGAVQIRVGRVRVYSCTGEQRREGEGKRLAWLERVTHANMLAP